MNFLTYKRIFFLASLQQTLRLFFLDIFKGICLSFVIGPPIVAAIIIIAQVFNLPISLSHICLDQ